MVRRAVLVDGKSRRGVAREFGIHRLTVGKKVKHACPLARANALGVKEPADIRLMMVALPQAGAELLFDVVSDRYEKGSIVLTTNLAFQEWVSVLASEPLTHAMLDRLTHHVHIFEMNGRSYRLAESLQQKAK